MPYAPGPAGGRAGRRAGRSPHRGPPRRTATAAGRLQGYRGRTQCDSCRQAGTSDTGGQYSRQHARACACPPLAHSPAARLRTRSGQVRSGQQHPASYAVKGPQQPALQQAAGTPRSAAPMQCTPCTQPQPAACPWQQTRACTCCTQTPLPTPPPSHTHTRAHARGPRPSLRPPPASRRSRMPSVMNTIRLSAAGPGRGRAHIHTHTHTQRGI